MHMYNELYHNAPPPPIICNIMRMFRKKTLYSTSIQHDMPPFYIIENSNFGRFGRVAHPPPPPFEDIFIFFDVYGVSYLKFKLYKYIYSKQK